MDKSHQFVEYIKSLDKSSARYDFQIDDDNK
jgi:hypothetical protein